MTTYIYADRYGVVRTTNRITKEVKRAREVIAVSNKFQRIRLIRRDKGQEYVFDYEKAREFTNWNFSTWFWDTVARITSLVSEVKLVDKLIEMFRE